MSGTRPGHSAASSSENSDKERGSGSFPGKDKSRSSGVDPLLSKIESPSALSTAGELLPGASSAQVGAVRRKHGFHL